MNTFAIIGAGFSGTVAAIEYLNRATDNTKLIIINRSGAIARGLAYGTKSPQHLLNVPAGNMTAISDKPNSFLDYCKNLNTAVAANSFVPRKVYGDYLEKMLNDAIKKNSTRVEIEQIVSEAVGLVPSEQGATITLSNGRTLQANQVALAFGHFPPTYPAELEVIAETHFFQKDPWQAPTASKKTENNSSIVLIGSGLTAVDVITNLIQSGHTGNIYMLSRRGLLPKAHRVSRGIPIKSNRTNSLLLESAPSIAKYLRIIREEINISSLQGGDWRDIIASIRPITAQLWRRLSVHERRKFLRHSQTYWDAHRHRVAPETYKTFERALYNNQIVPIAGRVISLEKKDNSILIHIKPRQKDTTQTITANLIINCTGPSSNLINSTDPLTRQLIKDDLITADILGLGLNVDQSFFVKNKTGNSSTWLSYVGPMLKADLWESTAVPELREAARSLAIKVCAIFEKTYQNRPPS